VPFDAPGASLRGRLTVDKLDHGGLPLVLAQTFRAIIHSRMKAGMENYRRSYPDADVVLFEPDREDADMFFANIFSYSQRRRLCATAFATTRANLRARAPELRAKLARHGIRMRDDRLDDTARDVRAALCDPRPIRAIRSRGRPCARRRASSAPRSTSSRPGSRRASRPHASGWPSGAAAGAGRRARLPRSWPTRSVRAARASASSRPRSRCSTATASRR
jgi:hypothetical protein